MNTRILFASLSIFASASAWAGDTTQQSKERGSWGEAQNRIYEAAWKIQPDSDILASMARSGLTDKALTLVKEMRQNSQAFSLRQIAKESRTITESQRINILEDSLSAESSPEGQVHIAMEFARIHRFDRAIAIGRTALAGAHGNLRYTNSIVRAIADSTKFSFTSPAESTELAKALAPDLLVLVRSVQVDENPYIYSSLAHVLALAGDQGGFQEAIDKSLLQVELLSRGQQRGAVSAIVDVVLRNDQEELAAEITSQKNALHEWVGYYARHRSYEKAESLTEGMSDTLYVSHLYASLESIIGIAVDNGDMKIASDMAEKLKSLKSSYAMQQVLIGRAYANIGNKEDASAAYVRAISNYAVLNEPNYSQNDAKALAKIAHASRLNGDLGLADKVISIMPAIIEKNYEKDIEARVMSRIYFAMILTESGDTDAASTLLVQAHEILSSQPESERKYYGFNNPWLTLAEAYGGALDLKIPGR